MTSLKEVKTLSNGTTMSIMQHAASIIEKLNDTVDGVDTFYICDLGASAKLCRHLSAVMPRVAPYYAVKCFPDPKLLATLAACGAGFDCASAGELKQVLSLGVDPNRVVFANPCKRFVDLKCIAHNKVPHTTFDSACELEKIASGCSEVGAVLRIRADDTTARMPFGVKYGALPSEVPELLKHALELGVAVSGVSFHVGSGAGNPMAFHDAIAAARRVRDELCALDGAAKSRLFLLDIGGGFTGGFNTEGQAFVSVGSSEGCAQHDEVAHVINKALDEFFDPFEFSCGGLKVISEPGRYFAEASAHVVTRVFGKRVRSNTASVDPGAGAAGSSREAGDAAATTTLQTKRAEVQAGGGHRRLVLRSAIDPSWRGDADRDDAGSSNQEEGRQEEQRHPREKQQEQQQQPAVSPPSKEVHYYISDGIYGGFNAIVYDGWLPKAVPFRALAGKASAVTSNPAAPTDACVSTIFGPTCDSLDMVFHGLPDCPTLEIGDWLLFPNCGAYTAAGATDFNGIPSSPFMNSGTKMNYVYARSHAVPDCERGSGAPKVLFSATAPLSVTKNY
mmetsp:Transcript_51817/g.102790  ORF Transcript_51817/g.102790 Transcript_51817/m.102790 type:complete len:562 (+) Transcript_51817:197-1882(+)